MNITLFVIWYIVGLILIQLILYIEKKGYYSKTENWTMGHLILELIFGIVGPVALIILLFSNKLVLKRAVYVDEEDD